MTYKILQAFKYSPDGVNVIQLAADDVRSIRADLVEGLVEGGYIEKATAKAEKKVEPPVIPADLTKLKAPALLKLAAAIAGEPSADEAAALAVVEAEVKRRAEAAAA